MVALHPLPIAAQLTKSSLYPPLVLRGVNARSSITHPLIDIPSLSWLPLHSRRAHPRGTQKHSATRNIDPHDIPAPSDATTRRYSLQSRRTQLRCPSPILRLASDCQLLFPVASAQPSASTLASDTAAPRRRLAALAAGDDYKHGGVTYHRPGPSTKSQLFQ